MIAPHWVRNRVRPIAVEDVVAYLMAALDLDIEGSAVFDNWRRRRRLIRRHHPRIQPPARSETGHHPLAIFPPSCFSSYWLGLVTSLYPPVGRRLIASVLKEHTDIDETTLRTFKIQPRGVKETVSRALENERKTLLAPAGRQRTGCLPPVDPLGRRAARLSLGGFPVHTCGSAAGQSLPTVATYRRGHRLVLRRMARASAAGSNPPGGGRRDAPR